MNLILAADENWGIGKDGDLLVRLPGDMEFFKEKTRGNVVVMGRATLESLPKKRGLAKRVNIVLTTRPDFTAERCEIVHSHEELFHRLEAFDSSRVFVIGGARVYRELLPYVDTCYITKIRKSFDADRHFVDLDADSRFAVTWMSEEKEENGVAYRFYKYERVRKEQ
ncbi:dihydrofolate reductase [Eubacterium pyruvativorans]|uniref:dihydrofolate reductase n=1 Tax=Eubacterium pyruvativorans TaxID=155865 RepID=UPI00240942DD|nr:dihydrofolate reductase [Eubacterium pyruvativorans]MDD6707621.1 dihydrofolate reductase [Eubacterium pyruvativorans]